jgi:hypothetical protein
MVGLHSDGASVIASFRVYPTQNYTLDQASLSLIQQNRVLLQRKEPRVSFPDKFDGTRFKCQGFINQIKLITVLQTERYSTEEARVGLVRTLLT